MTSFKHVNLFLGGVVTLKTESTRKQQLFVQ